MRSKYGYQIKPAGEQGIKTANTFFIEEPQNKNAGMILPRISPAWKDKFLQEFWSIFDPGKQETRFPRDHHNNSTVKWAKQPGDRIVDRREEIGRNSQSRSRINSQQLRQTLWILLQETPDKNSWRKAQVQSGSIETFQKYKLLNYAPCKPKKYHLWVDYIRIRRQV